MSRRTNTWFLAAALFAALLFPACGGGGGGGGAGGTGGEEDVMLRVLVTDAPFPYESVQSATVNVQRVELRDGAENFTTLVDFSAEGGRELDLVQLRNGTMDTLFEGDPAPGTYDLVRIIVTAVEITILDDGEEKTFDEFKVPSGPQTGVKVFIDPPLDVVTGLSRDLVLDFDLAGSFVVQGNPDTPAGIKGFHFQPVVRAVNASTAGSLSFVVMSDSGTPGVPGDDVPLNRAGYEVTDAADETEASGASDADGSVFHPAIPAGGYDLEVQAAGHEDHEQGIVIAAANLADLGTITLALAQTRIFGTASTTLETTGGDTLDLVVPGATVDALAEGTDTVVKTDETSATGAYEMANVPSGTYDLRAAAEGYETATGQAVVSGGDAEADLVLVALTGDVTGTVRNGSGNLVTNATIQAVVTVGTDDEVIAETTTDGNGEYTLEGLPTGFYSIEATTDDAIPLVADQTLDHTGGGDPVTVDLTVE